MENEMNKESIALAVKKLALTFGVSVAIGVVTALTVHAIEAAIVNSRVPQPTIES